MARLTLCLVVLAVLCGSTLGERLGGVHRLLQAQDKPAESLADLQAGLVNKVVDHAKGLLDKLAHLNVTDLLTKATQAVKQAAAKVDVTELAEQTNKVAGMAANIVDEIVEHAAPSGTKAVITSMGALPARQRVKDNSDANTSV